jgi:hypothetical protein
MPPPPLPALVGLMMAPGPLENEPLGECFGVGVFREFAAMGVVVSGLVR